MDGWLTARRKRLRTGAVITLVVTAVVVAHGLLLSQLKLTSVARKANEPPSRMTVSYVAQLKPSAPSAQRARLAPQVVAAAATVDVRAPRAALAPTIASSAPAAAPHDSASGHHHAELALLAREAALASEIDEGQADPVEQPTAQPGRASEQTAEIGHDDTDDPHAQALVRGSGGHTDDGTVSSTSTDDDFEWPVSTRLSYTMAGYYQGEVGGSAQVEWIRNGAQYEVHLDVTVGLRIAPLLTRVMSSRGDITPQGLAPRQYDEMTKRAFSDPWRVRMHFEADRVLAGGHRTWPRPVGVQDTASQFVQLSWLFAQDPSRLHAGQVITLPLALPRQVSPWTYDVQGEELLYTPFGAVPAVRLQPRHVATGRGDMAMELWFAPSLRYLPVRIRIHHDPQTFVDLMISRLPDIAAR